MVIFEDYDSFTMNNLLSDIRKLMFIDGDVNIELINNDKRYTFPVPSFMLKCRSVVFSKMLETNMKEKLKNHINLTCYSGISVLLMLEWIMTDTYGVFDYGKIGISFQIEIDHYFELLMLADMFRLIELGAPVQNEIINSIDQETVKVIKEYTTNSFLNLEEIVQKCEEYRSILPEMHLGLNEINLSHYFMNEIYEYSLSDCEYPSYVKLINLAKEISQKIYLVPISCDRLSYGRDCYFIYRPVLECTMTQKFPFLQGEWKKMFWQLKVVDPDNKSNVMIARSDTRYNPNINNIYGLKCCPNIRFGVPFDPEDDIAIKYELGKLNHGHNLHFAFVNSIKKLYGFSQ